MYETIQGIKYKNFGTNTYSEGMEAIVFNAKDITHQEVAKLPNIYLHPTVEPDSMDIFAIKGSAENYEKFYEAAVTSHCTKLVHNRLESYRFKLEDQPEYKEFTPWYKK